MKKRVIILIGIVTLALCGTVGYLLNRGTDVKSALQEQADNILKEAKQNEQANKFLQHVSIKVKDVKDDKVTFVISTVDMVSLTKQIAQQTSDIENATVLIEETKKKLESSLASGNFETKSFTVTCTIHKNEDKYTFEETAEFTDAIFGGLIKELEHQLKERD